MRAHVTRALQADDGRLLTAESRHGQSVSANDLFAHCRRSLATYKVPRRIEFSDDELPKSGSGKLLKRILRERFRAHQEQALT